ncbi:MAG: hypothetical protein WD989_01185 [Candidatus Paceibacterota bacterium]
MNFKLNFIFALTASALGLVLFSAEGGPAFGGPNVINVTGQTLAVVQDDWKLVDKIEEAKRLLESSPSLRFDEESQKDRRGRIVRKNGRVVLEMTRKEIALAILDTETGRIFEKRYWLNMAEINKANDLRKKYQNNLENLPRFQPDDPNEEFHVVNNWWNSFNSDLAIVKDGASDRYVVVANKYLMSNDDLAYPEDRKGEKYSDIVYVPYSAFLKDKTLIAAGKKFLNDHVKEAFDELTSAGVGSVSFPNRRVTDTITQTFVKNIFLTEHTDPKMMLLSNDGGLELAERVLIRLGTNGEKAFRYTVSKTGASGLGQIMPGTYNSIVRRYPVAQLIQNTDIGRVDIKNAIKASALVFDDHLATVVGRVNASSKAKQIFVKKTEAEVDEIRAAIYNGGPSKYKHLTGNISTAVTETVLFVRKFKMIRELGLFDQYAEAAQQ